MRRLMAAASLFALMAGAAAAQTPQALSVGGRVNGALRESDPSTADYRYEDYRFTARAGQRLEAVLRSEAFDAYLAVFREGATGGEPLAEDDDGLGEGTHARLRFTPETAGTYVLRVRTLEGDSGGDYALTLSERPPAARPPRPRPVRIGETVDADISARDPEDDDDLRYDAYSFRARAGERVAIRVTADEDADLDPLLKVGRMNGPDFAELAGNDDTDGLNPYLVFTAPAAGEYVVRAGALRGTGAYRLQVEEGPPPLPAKDIAIGGDSVSGAIAEGDARNDGGYPADAYRFNGRAGQRVRAVMTSDDFDTHLTLRREGASEALAENDDGGDDGTNSLLVHTLPEDGVYLLEARALSNEETGDYELTLTETAPEREPATLAAGVKVEGAIEDADPRDEEDRGFDAYAVQGRAGQRMQAIMRSGDFDTYLRIGKAGGEFEELASDDDGLGRGTDSRLNFTFPEDGAYVLRASPLSAKEDGLYSLELLDRGPEPRAGSILVGAKAYGTLSEDDSSAEDGSFFDAYEVEAKDGETLRITMTSNAFDAVVHVGQMKDGEWEELEADDDGLSDTHARLDWEVPRDGTYVIRAGSFAQGGLGEYVLTVEKKP